MPTRAALDKTPLDWPPARWRITFARVACRTPCRWNPNCLHSALSESPGKAGRRLF